MTENERYRQEGYSLNISLDPVWFAHRKLIENVANKIGTPKTSVGENISKEISFNSVVQAYPRLRKILNSLISLIEFDEIEKLNNNEFFSDPMVQRIVIRALGFKLEDSVKGSYSSDEEKKYDDYKPFFEGLLGELKKLDAIIASEGSNLRFINRLFFLTSQEINKLKGVTSFKINTNIIRLKIKNYLPQLEKLENGKIFDTIVQEFKEMFTPQS